MTRGEAIELANDMAFMASIWIDDESNEVNDLVKFANLVAAKQRKVCYDLLLEMHTLANGSHNAYHCAAVRILELP